MLSPGEIRPIGPLEAKLAILSILFAGCHSPDPPRPDPPRPTRTHPAPPHPLIEITTFSKSDRL